MIGAAVFAMLQASPAAVAVLADRVYPVELPADSLLPAVAYQLIDERRGALPRGMSRQRRSLLQLSVVGRDYDEAHAVAELLRSALDRQRGQYGGVYVQDVIEHSSRDEPGDASPQLLPMTWRIAWRPA